MEEETNGRMESNPNAETMSDPFLVVTLWRSASMHSINSDSPEMWMQLAPTVAQV
jgi:hypothetical protein